MYDYIYKVVVIRSKAMGKIRKGIKWFLISIMSVFLLVWGGLNISKYFIYRDYYTRKTDICINPGLNDNFVPQGIAVSDTEDLILTSGYMKDKTASRIYITNSKNEERYVELYQGDKISTKHFGGIALSGDIAYLATSSRIFPIALSDILNNDEIDIGDGIEVPNSASFVYADNEYLYVGEFHDGGKYVTDHPIETRDGTYYAICTMYSLSDYTTPLRVYSLPNKVQGFAIDENGTIVLSTSYGLADSKYYIYRDVEASGKEYLGAPLYILDSYSDVISGPAMSEDLSYKDGKFYCLSESASDKYIFGKFFFANSIYALDVSE